MRFSKACLRQQTLDQGLDGRGTGLDHQVGDFAVVRLAAGHPVAQRALGIGRGQQRAVAVAAGAAEQFVHAGPQIDDDAALVQPLAVFRRQDGAAAGGENNVAPLGTLFQCGGFPATETGLALDFEDYRHTHAATRLQLMIQIDEVAPQGARQAAAYGRLARPHHAHQEHGQVMRQGHGLAGAFGGAGLEFGRLAGGRQVRVSLRT